LVLSPVRKPTLRKRIVGTGTALVLAVTFAVMAATGSWLAGRHATTGSKTTTSPAGTLTVPLPVSTLSQTVTRG
jgi:hypothetical protein